MSSLIRPISLVLCFVLLVIKITRATTIVIIVTPQSVTLGADSRGSFYDYVSLKEVKKNVTKIYKTGEYYFAIAGLANDPNTSVNPSQIISKHLKSQKSLILAIDSIKSELSQILKSELVYQKKIKKKSFYVQYNQVI